MNSTSFAVPHRVMVVDRWPLVRSAVAELLDRAETTEVTGMADTAEEAWDLYHKLRPDLVITDCGLLAPADGLRLGRRLRGLESQPQVLIYSSSNEPDVIAACLSGASDGFVHRSAEPEDLLLAVDLLAAGRPSWFFGRRTVRPPVRRQPDHDMSIPQLTTREQEVLGLLLQRYSNDEIAAELYLAKQTVKNYVSTVLQKLEIPSRRELHTRLAARPQR